MTAAKMKLNVNKELSPHEMLGVITILHTEMYKQEKMKYQISTHKMAKLHDRMIVHL